MDESQSEIDEDEFEAALAHPAVRAALRRVFATMVEALRLIESNQTERSAKARRRALETIDRLDRKRKIVTKNGLH